MAKTMKAMRATSKGTAKAKAAPAMKRGGNAMKANPKAAAAALKKEKAAEGKRQMAMMRPCKRPAAGTKDIPIPKKQNGMPPQESITNAVEKKHGLDMYEITRGDRRKFNETMKAAVDARRKGKFMAGNQVPDETIDEYEALTSKEDMTPGKFAAMQLLRKAWKADPHGGIR